MAYLLDKMGIETRLHPAPGLIATDTAMRADDAALAVTFAPFSAETVDFAARAARVGVAVHGLTDSESCPLEGAVGELLVAREDEVAGFRAPTAAIALTTAISVAAGAFRTDR